MCMTVISSSTFSWFDYKSRAKNLVFKKHFDDCFKHWLAKRKERTNQSFFCVWNIIFSELLLSSFIACVTYKTPSLSEIYELSE